LQLIPLLNKYHVTLITPFTEMEGIKKYPDLIKQMYTEINGAFDGEIGFEEATNHLINGYCIACKNGQSMFPQLAGTFWNWHDKYSRPMVLEYSAWDVPLITDRDQRLSLLEKAFYSFWKQPVDYYRAKYPDNQQIFGEIGARNVDGYCLGPEKLQMIPASQRVYDEQEMADLFYAIFTGSKKLGVNSINVWTFPLGDLWPNEAGSGGHAPGSNFINIGRKYHELPAYRVITAIINPEEGD
jgi:hypothetical protein